MAIGRIFTIALAIRILLVLVGGWVDKYSNGVDFTDIDYHVFSDAAKLLNDGQSPYERATYRYPPLLAALLVPNAYFADFGKILFCLSDAALVFEIYWYCKTFDKKQHGLLYANMWAFNVATMCICARGSADSLTNYLVLVVLRLVLQLRTSNSLVVGVGAGIAFGTLIYMRVYPIIFAPAFVVSILFSTSKRTVSMLSVIVLAVSTIATLTALMAGSYYFYGTDYIDNALLYHLSREDHRHNFSIHFYGIYLSRDSGTTYSAVFVDSLTNMLPAGFVNSLALWVYKTIDSVWLYAGGNILDQVTMDGVLGGLSGLVLFAPQMLLFAAVVATFAPRNLPVCLLLQTMIFVSYNKVITAQYFTWYWCLIPVTMQSLRHIPRNTAMVCAALWGGTLGWWLYCAYQLEFEGQSNFLVVWQASLLFHVVSVLCIALIAFYAPRSISAEHKESTA